MFALVLKAALINIFIPRTDQTAACNVKWVAGSSCYKGIYTVTTKMLLLCLTVKLSNRFDIDNKFGVI